MPAVCLTDHGVMFGALEFYTKAKKAKIKPIIGCEFYVAEKSRFDKDQYAGHNFHLVLLAMDGTGYRNLMKLASSAQTEGFYYKPRIDNELLQAHHEGLIAFSACLHGEIAWRLTHNDREGARKRALELQALVRRPALFRTAGKRHRGTAPRQHWTAGTWPGTGDQGGGHQ